VGAGALTARPPAVGVTGASGFVGRALAADLEAHGYRVVRFVRGRAARAGEIAWDPGRGVLAPDALAELDAVVHLSGAGLADAPWTPARKRTLVESRVASTALLARTLAGIAGSKPRVLVSASAVGWYGDRGDEVLSETSGGGEGFLAELAQAWEAAAEPARAAGVRVVHPRIAIVLAATGGALAQLVTPFRLGVGGPLGAGSTWWSWITLADLKRVVRFVLARDALAGPVNAASPAPARQRELARALAAALGRPCWLPAPAFALRLLLGRERADAMLFASQRALPDVLLQAGFAFDDPELAPALARMFGSRPRPPARVSDRT